jgi:predicted MPP superfamily phosphohydrolase
MTVGTIWGSWLVVVASASLLRNRVYAAFAGVVLGVVCSVWTGLFAGLDGPLLPVVLALQVATLVHFVALSRARMRPAWFRALVSIPGLWFVAGSMLAVPWAIARALGLEPWGWWLPYLACAFGVYQSLRNPWQEVNLQIDGSDAGELARVDPGRPPGGPHLSIAQITDPHLGPFMSVARLRAACHRVVAASPDLVLLTGDLVTMESQRDVDGLVRALEPLRALPGRVFACLGNHDHEARQTVSAALAAIGAHLLVDRAVRVSTPVGPVEIAGADFVFRNRGQHLAALAQELGPRDGVPRLLLLHDPGAFRHLPDGAADLTLSGHTHGGHVGLLSLGYDWTAIRALFRLPDHGFWAQGRNRMYVHRGTGHYGFPIRLGVPGEEGILRLYLGTQSS